MRCVLVADSQGILKCLDLSMKKMTFTFGVTLTVIEIWRKNNIKINVLGQLLLQQILQPSVCYITSSLFQATCISGSGAERVRIGIGKLIQRRTDITKDQWWQGPSKINTHPHCQISCLGIIWFDHHSQRQFYSFKRVWYNMLLTPRHSDAVILPDEISRLLNLISMILNELVLAWAWHGKKMIDDRW